MLSQSVFKKALLIVAALGLTACNDIEGTLKAYEDLTLKKGRKTQVVPAGTYLAKIEVESKEVDVKIQVGGDTEKFEFAIPKDALKGNRFDIPAEVTGQAYGLAGTRDVEERMSPPQQDWESCQYEEWYRRCGVDRQGRHVCWDERVTRWGQRWVEYQDRDTTYIVDAELVTQDNRTAADFSGSRTVTERLYRRVGVCR